MGDGSNRDNQPKLSRRKLLKRAMLLSTTACLAGGLYTWRVEPHWLGVTEHDMPLADLPRAWRGRTIVHLTDLHVGPVVSDAYLRRAMKQTNALQPDMIVITGDLMSYDGDHRINQVADLLGELTAPPLGTLAVLGNHDYGRRFRDDRVAQRMVDALQPIGIRVLRNETVTVDGLQFVGADEVWANRCDVARALAGYDATRAGVALIHNPDIVDMPEWSRQTKPFRGWLLAGHTHGGQIDPPFFAPPRLPVVNKQRFAGRYDIAPDQTLYINTGVGYLRRVRFNCRPEIARFTVRSA